MHVVLIEGQRGQRRYINLDTVVDALYLPAYPGGFSEEDQRDLPPREATMLLDAIAPESSTDGYASTAYRITLRGHAAQVVDRALFCARQNKWPGQSRPEYLPERTPRSPED